jgi:hypothetical protein
MVGGLVVFVAGLLWANAAAAAVVPGAPDYPIDTWTQINVDRVDTSYLVPGKNTAETFKPEAGTGAGQSFYFFVKGGTVNKVVVFYQGGGACWDFSTCSGSEGIICKTTLTTLTEMNSRLKDFLDPTAGTTFTSVMDGAEETYPTSPFHDWYKVFVPYATCDVHIGNNTVTYIRTTTSGTQQLQVYHKGMANSLSVVKWIDENFGDPDPEQLFLSGSSAGSIGAIASAPYYMLFPSSQVTVLGDAGIFRLTPYFEKNALPNWKLDLMWPTFIPSLASGPTLLYNDEIKGFAGLWENIVPHYSTHKFAEYTDSSDDTQRFYNYRAHRFDPNDKTTQQAAGDDWEQDMRSYTNAMWQTNPNYRYYIAPGIGHVILNNNPKIFSLKVANSLENGAEATFIDFLTSELSSDITEPASSVKPSVDHRVFEVKPSTIQAGMATDITIVGRNFTPGATVTFTPSEENQLGSPPTVSNVRWENLDAISATVTANDAGIWNVVVTQASADTATLQDATLLKGFAVDGDD